MPERDEQANAYLHEAKTTLESAQVLFERKPAAFAPQIVKNGYDALEQALSAGLAARGEDGPKRHHTKIQRYFEPLDERDLERVAFGWYARRSDAQYVDFRGDELSVPSDNFDFKDAEQMLIDATSVLDFVEEELQRE